MDSNFNRRGEETVTDAFRLENETGGERRGPAAGRQPPKPKEHFVERGNVIYTQVVG